ncbi:hypothetical protein JX266_004327 [Neoarthrinium moseri]|nr:hypothetical protein JX266_004327 [Neoarthrinium moseri]
MVQQPYLYDPDRSDPRFSPTKPFDPKAITRASWESKPSTPKKKDGPLMSFNQHPDLHEVPPGRNTNFRPMSNRTKSWIVGMRRVQLGLRCFELVGAVGLVTLMILISNVDPLTAWVMRIAPGVFAIASVYAIWHLSRSAGSRTPASSAAYQLFAAFTDVAILIFYVYGGLSVVNHGTEWGTLLYNETLVAYFVPAYYYTLIGAGGLHVVSLLISLWLGLMFRRITNMPPDMNPLEDHLTARHKRNKSSIATSYMTESSRRLSTPLEERRRSGAPYETLSRPPSIPFMHTRSNSRDSFVSSKGDLPSRQYQVEPSNSPRNSVASAAELKRLSKPASNRGSYTEIPLHETGSPRHSNGIDSPNASPTRVGKFTESWYASESLINRTQQRQRAMNAAATSANASKSRAYEAVSQQYDDVSDDDSDRENNMRPDLDDMAYLADSITGNGSHPNPLRSNPTPVSSVGSSEVSSVAPPVPSHGVSGGPRSKTPYYPRVSALGEISSNRRSVSGSQDITDQKPGMLAAPVGAGMGRNRDSSIQPEDAFYSKPYGDLKPATPPIMVGTGRQVSSGNDYDLGSAPGAYGKYRRNVSGKAAEEGMAGKRYSRYSVLNDD